MCHCVFLKSDSRGTILPRVTKGQRKARKMILMSGYWIEEERQRRERHAEVIYDPEKAISTFQHSVIMGGPGAGKTTLLRHLAIMAAQGSIVGMPSLLPIYVELQSFVRSGLHDLLDFVSTTWEEAYAFPAWQARLLL